MLNLLELVLIGLVAFFRDREPAGSQPIELHFLSYIRQVQFLHAIDYFYQTICELLSITYIKGNMFYKVNELRLILWITFLLLSYGW
jgi:hypothetical protein